MPEGNIEEYIKERQKTRKDRFEMCRGCDFLSEKIQVQSFEDDALTRIIPSREVMMPFCKFFDVHLEGADQIIQKISEKLPYCDEFKN